MKKLLIIMTILFIVSIGFALESTLTFKGGASQAKTDIDDHVKTNGMIGLSYEVWMAKWLSLGLHPYITRVEAGPDETIGYKSNVVGGDLLLRLRPNWRPIAPYITAGAGIVNFFPKTLNGHHIIGTPEDYSYTSGVAPTVGAGLMIFTKHGIDFELGVQNNMMMSDYLDGWKYGSDKDSYWLAFLGVSHTFGKIKKPAPAPEPEPVVVPVVEEPKVPEPVLTVAPTSHKVASSGGAVKSMITANNPWTARTDSNWIHITPTSGNGNATLNIMYDENPAFEPRTGKIFISSADLNQIITVYQDAKVKPALVLKPVYFDFNEYELTNTATATLDEVLASLAFYPEVKLMLSGNADEIGGLKYNQKLSEKRADVVKQYLVGKGIAADRISTIGYGKTKPIAENKTEAGRAQNRRTDITEVK
jgi:outer membrane protein OmpA-like peptidoglycan-associated protein